MTYDCPNGCCSVDMGWDTDRAVRKVTLNGAIYMGLHALAVELGLGSSGLRKRIENGRCLRESKQAAWARGNDGRARKAARLKGRPKGDSLCNQFAQLRW